TVQRLPQSAHDASRDGRATCRSVCHRSGGRGGGRAKLGMIQGTGALTMANRYDRREMLQMSASALLGGLIPTTVCAAEGKGAVVGEPTAARAGMDVLTAGGNAVDAAVTAALVAAVVAPHQCGIGGCRGG